MNSTEALDLVEQIFIQTKAATIRAELGNYWFIAPEKKRFFVNTELGFVTYLEVYQNDILTETVFESVTQVVDGEEVRFGDQWSPLIELTPEEQTRFNDMLNVFLS